MAHDLRAPWADRVEGIGPLTADDLFAMGDASHGQGDTALAPDLAFVRAERVPALEAPGSDKFPRLAPDLVAEVASPGQSTPIADLFR
jgi:Uma2 family endonuclease